MSNNPDKPQLAGAWFLQKSNNAWKGCIAALGAFFYHPRFAIIGIA